VKESSRETTSALFKRDGQELYHRALHLMANNATL